MSSYSSPHKDGESSEEKEFDLSHRQHARDNTTAKGEDIAVKEEVEDEYYKMGYEDAPMQDISEVKEELGNGYDGSMKIEEIDIKEELIEPMQEPSDTEDRQGEKRRAHSRSCSPDSKKQRPEVEEVRVEYEPEYDKSALSLDRAGNHHKREGKYWTAKMPHHRFTMDYERQMEKLREMVERELDLEDTGLFLDEEPDEEESEEEEEGVAQEEAVDEEEITDEEGRAEADDVLQISPDEDTDESNDEDEQQPTRYTEKQFIGKNKTLWKEVPPHRQRRTRAHNIYQGSPGPKGAARHAHAVKDCWSLFVTQELLNELVACTNIYIDSKQGKYKDQSKEKRTDEREMKAAIGLIYLLGVFRANRMNIEDAWATDGTGIEIFPTTMSLQRFRFLLRSMRFDDIITRAERRLEDKFAAFRKFFEKFVDNCISNYNISEYATVDEMLAAFRGKCPFRVYMPSKPAKYGIKIFILADAKTFYVSRMEVYLGKQPEGPFVIDNSGAAVVKRLVSHINGSGRNIMMDNWFTSYGLAVDLVKNYRLTLVGTLRKNKAELPPQFIATRGRTEYTSLFGFQKDVTLTSYVPKKGKNVVLLSTMHHDAAIDESTKEKRKPEIITFYNSTKGGVDTVDQLCSIYNVSRNTRRWPVTVFYTILNVAGINAYNIFMANSQTAIRRRKFLKELGLKLVEDHIQHRKTNPHLRKDLKRKIQHFSASKELPPKRHREDFIQRCSLCPRSKDRKTRNCCQKCYKPICLEHAIHICVDCSAQSDEDDSVNNEDE
ncbi:piggyBac transposable element-derived protein 4-like isoform X3 [Macrobrachium rosenbergii]